MKLVGPRRKTKAQQGRREPMPSALNLAWDIFGGPVNLIGHEALNTYRFRPNTPKCPALEQYYISGMNFPARPSLYVKPSIIRVIGRVESTALKLLEKQ